MTQGVVTILVGTQKGLFRVTPEAGSWRIEGPQIAGYEVQHAWLDERLEGRGYAAVTHAVWGSHVYTTTDGGATWRPLPAAPSHPTDTYGSALRAVWHLAPGDWSNPEVLYAGIDPAGLFRSPDGGSSWSPIPGINEHPSREQWEPARGGFSLHSIHVDRHDPQRVYCAVSAGGAFRSDDGGASWKPINQGVRAENRPERAPRVGHNIHRLIAHPALPGRLYRQCYNGVYRSDDAGEQWTEISAGLPSDFGYPVVSPRSDPDTVHVVPVASNHLRTPPEGRLRVYRSRDAGATWEPLWRGLPQEHAYVTVLREAMDCGGPNDELLALGTSGGHLFVSEDGGGNWALLAGFLPRILSVRIAGGR